VRAPRAGAHGPGDRAGAAARHGARPGRALGSRDL